MGNFINTLGCKGMAPNASNRFKGLVPVPSFNVLLNEVLEDKYVIRLPEKIQLASLSALEIAEQVSKDLEQQGTRQEAVERHNTDHGRPTSAMPANAAAAVQQPLPHPVAGTARAAANPDELLALPPEGG